MEEPEAPPDNIQTAMLKTTPSDKKADETDETPPRGIRIFHYISFLLIPHSVRRKEVALMFYKLKLRNYMLEQLRVS